MKNLLLSTVLVLGLGTIAMANNVSISEVPSIAIYQDKEYKEIKWNNSNQKDSYKLIDIDNLFFKLSNKILDSSSPVKLEEFNIFTNRTIDVITGLAKILNNKNDYNNPDERISMGNNSLDKIKEILLKNINEEGLKDFEISLTLLWTEK